MTEEAYELAACGLITTKPDGVITRCNRTACAWLGRSVEELQQLKFQDLLTMGSKLFHHTQWMPLLHLQGSVAEVQLELVARDGRVIPALINAVERKSTATDTSVVEIAVFIASDRRKYERELLSARQNAERLLTVSREAQRAREDAETKLRLALDSSSLGIWDYDFEAGARRYEANVAALVGVGAAERVTPELYAASIHPEDREAERAAFVALLDGRKDAPYAVEYRLQGRDGVERRVKSTALAFSDESGRVTRLSGVLQDVTLIRQQEREAQHRAVLAEQLIGIVSHDLRNPLNVVVLGSHALESTVEGVHKRVVHRITAAAERANRLITDLLDFTQARLGGGLRVTCKETDLHTLVAECVEEVKLAWPGRMVVHRRSGSGACFADPDRLAQVVSNLANNAFAYGPPSAPVVVTTVGTEAGAEILVHNEGPQIPIELQEKIFEPLQRGEQQVSLGSRSVGLGLYIVQQVANAHHGTVTVRSMEGEGTTFTVTLPHGSSKASAPPT